MKIKINEKLPDCEVFQLINEEPVKIKISSLFSNKKIILLGMPGAFTSVCSAKHLPSFINFSKKFYEKGCLLYTSPSPRDVHLSRMPSSA